MTTIMMINGYYNEHMPKLFLAGCTLLAGTCEQSHSETLLAHLGSVLGSHDPGQMGIMT